MNVELYICEGELTETSNLYIPDFNHHEHRDMSYPKGDSWVIFKTLKDNGATVLKIIDITQNKNINDKELPTTRYLLVVDN